MSAFIVISVKESLNWIVDGIKDCRPHNTDVTTYMSCGKIIKKNRDEYMYEYAAYSKHAESGITDAAITNAGQDIPRNIFKNQIAQFLRISENDGSPINIFILDNPVTEDDFNQSDWLMREIQSVYLSHSITAFQLVKVLFSYHIDRPADVSRQVSKDILKKLFADFNQNSADGPLTRILYIDNQDCNGAAMCLNKQSHDIMLPRMLSDLMMLMSNKNDTYNTTAAISSPTNIFAVGYSECMYYHDDVFKYYRLANERDLKEYMLEDKNDIVSLDFEKEPYGIEDRQRRLALKYEPVPFDKDISSYQDSIDKEIDDILCSFKEDIIEIKNKALKEASEKDKKATEKVRMDFLKSVTSDENETSSAIVLPEEQLQNTNNMKGCNFLFRLFHRQRHPDSSSTARLVDPRVAHIIVTEETQKMQSLYPDFINREHIYKQYIVDGDHEDLNKNISDYEVLVKFVQSKRFKVFLEEKYNDSPSSSRLWDAIMTKLESIRIMQEERKAYEMLKIRINEIRMELDRINDDIKNFRLTTHCTSVDNLIDLDKMREFHSKGKESRVKKIVGSWRKLGEDSRTVASLLEVLAEQTKWDLYDFYYIKWDNQFEFIKQINLTDVCRRLISKSQPFVNFYTLEPTASNDISYHIYTDNADWSKAIENGEVDLKNKNKVSSILSSHICSKICMFQFMQLSHELIEGLTDCYELC